jgi:hypothetical protein
VIYHEAANGKTLNVAQQVFHNIFYGCKHELFKNGF